MNRVNNRLFRPWKCGVGWLSALTIAWVPLFVLMVGIPTAEASPAWARKYNVTCTLCHSAWPTLNKYGREFKLAGFRSPEELANPESMNTIVDDFLTLDKSFPLAARVLMRPFDKQKDQPAKIRAFHEVELLIGGHVGKNVSAWLEAEAEDEDGFNLFVEQGVLGFHPSRGANITMGWAPVFWSDPFATLVDGGHRMTRGHKGPLDQGFSAGEKMRNNSQFVSFYGSAGKGRVFYMGGISSGGGDPEGGDSRDGFGKVMVEAAPGLYLGGFIYSGANDVQGTDLNFRRTGFEFQVEHGKLTLYGVVLNAKDDLLGGGDHSTTVAYVESFLTIPFERFPLIVPLARVDKLDGYTDLTLQMNFYLLDNLKAYGEWWQNVNSPSGVTKKNRFTIQVDFAF